MQPITGSHITKIDVLKFTTRTGEKDFEDKLASGRLMGSNLNLKMDTRGVSLRLIWYASSDPSTSAVTELQLVYGSKPIDPTPVNGATWVKVNQDLTEGARGYFKGQAIWLYYRVGGPGYPIRSLNVFAVDSRLDHTDTYSGYRLVKGKGTGNLNEGCGGRKFIYIGYSFYNASSNGIQSQLYSSASPLATNQSVIHGQSLSMSLNPGMNSLSPLPSAPLESPSLPSHRFVGNLSSSTLPHSHVLLPKSLQRESKEAIKLAQSPQEIQSFDDLSDIYSIIRTVEIIEKAYTKSAISQEDYEQTLVKLVSQYKRAQLACQSHFSSFSDFAREYKLECPLAHERLEVLGLPEDKNKDKLIAETVQCFMTAMDNLEMKLNTTDDVYLWLDELLTYMNKFKFLPNDFEAKTKIRSWIKEIDAMPPGENLVEDKQKLLKHDLQRCYSAFHKALDR
eukprot:TRINITY_DN8263_c0_g1_i1.p1 TRINITY_DN8263_c0_g1~~TRINITY_DN8263_c0_g1_i1.p1  ORF type:complete len:463 (+),score=73.89 TRINITY_DN8263_c0_g1_i1:41-1390(+)